MTQKCDQTGSKLQNLMNSEVTAVRRIGWRRGRVEAVVPSDRGPGGGSLRVPDVQTPPVCLVWKSPHYRSLRGTSEGPPHLSVCSVAPLHRRRSGYFPPLWSCFGEVMKLSSLDSIELQKESYANYLSMFKTKSDPNLCKDRDAQRV